jgi:hypothetical protein
MSSSANNNHNNTNNNNNNNNMNNNNNNSSINRQSKQYESSEQLERRKRALKQRLSVAEQSTGDYQDGGSIMQQRLAAGLDVASGTLLLLLLLCFSIILNFARRVRFSDISSSKFRFKWSNVFFWFFQSIDNWWFDLFLLF